MGATHTVEVELGDRGYAVHVGPAVRELLPETLADMVPRARRAAVVSQEGIPWSVDLGIEHCSITIPDGEEAKSLAVVERTCGELARQGFTRNDVVIAVGGGVVTDVAGFVAAVYHRGIRFVSVPTTLLGQIDAAIGGKTGVNLPEGKNLVGAFWQPSVVLCDTDTLATLPPREMRSGQGELAKYHFLGGGRLDELDIDDQVAACVRIKAEVVAADEREGDRRAVLNYGHTLAHAIETAGRYDVRHGEAVGIGIAYAAEVAVRLERIDGARVAEHRRVLAAYDLPTRLPDELGDDELMALFHRDKKAIDGVTLVLDGDNGVESVTGVDESILRDALSAVR